MHKEAYRYVSKFSTTTAAVVELGSRNTYGARIRDLFDGCAYIGVDAVDGPDVDIVANAAEWQPDTPVDLVVCCELFEHSPRWREVVANSWQMLRPQGRAVFTCAGPGRAVHGVNHDDPDRPGWYRNVTAAEMRDAMTAAGYVDVEAAQVRHRSTTLGGSDIHATGIRP